MSLTHGPLYSHRKFITTFLSRAMSSKEDSPTPEPPKKVQRTGKSYTPPLVDSKGFKMKQIYVDAANLTPSERVNLPESAKHIEKTIRQEEEDVTYTIDGPLRRVSPYYFTYMTHCKERWRDMKLIDMFTSEFRLYPREHYIQAIKTGQVTINTNTVADLDTVIRNGDLISHRMHRHEPPVTSRPIKIVHQDEELLIIDKPAGIPVHPTGRYRHNSVTFILENEIGIKAHPCNRLDRLTSGVMMLGKTAKGAQKMVKQVSDRAVRKTYIAKVIGEFPVEEEGIVVDLPLLTLDPRLAFNVVDTAKGKPAVTKFKRISYDGETSIVKCLPMTGRTHQIRVHLQYLGFPIANDPLYSSPLIWGPNLGKNGEFDRKDVVAKLSEVGKTKAASSWLHHEADNKGELQMSGVKCPDCNTELYSDPGPNDLDLYLHAYSYESNRNEDTEVTPWKYSTEEFPEWATVDHIKFMKLSIEQAKKCPPTKTSFCVGSVIVYKGEIISTGYSNELPGNTHAEQCALEKYFTKTGARRLPKGCELYTTMEPCSKRLSGNLPCVDRILEYKDSITTVFVGVMEPDIFVKNNVSRDLLEQAGVGYWPVPGFEAEAISVAKFGHDG